MPDRTIESDRLLSAFNFRVTFTGAGGAGNGPLDDYHGGFAECSGLELEADVKELLEGGNNDRVIRRVGRVKLAPIVLKRGMFVAGGGAADPAFWRWITRMIRGQLPTPRYDGVIEVRDRAGSATVATWRFARGLPSKVVGPQLNARTGEVAIEELHIVHESLMFGAIDD